MKKLLTMKGSTIIDAVITKLSNTFPDIPVYDETINQGTPYPYFMVYARDFRERKLMRESYLQTYVISVLYQYKELPETSYSNFNQINYEVIEALRLIDLPNKEKVRGYMINSYPDDQRFEVYVNYDVKVVKEPDTEVAKQLKNSVNIYHKENK